MKTFVFLFLTCALTLNSFSQEQYYVTAENGLLARKSPDRGSEVLAKLNHGASVTIVEHSGMKQDVMDNGRKISGEWVKVDTNMPYDSKHAYVFNGYLSKKPIRPKTIARFEDMNVVIFDMNLYPKTRPNDDGLRYEMQPGQSPEDKLISVVPMVTADRINLYQAVEIGMTFSNSEQVCTLPDAKLLQSEWRQVKPMSFGIFRTMDFSDMDWKQLINLSTDEIYDIIKKHCGEAYLNQVNIKSPDNSKLDISIDRILLKAEVIDRDGNVIEKILSFDIPKGC